MMAAPAAEMGPEDSPRQALNPSALSLADAVRLLSAAGGQRVTVEMLQEDVAAGAPTNADGTISLLNYAAWLNSHVSQPHMLHR